MQYELIVQTRRGERYLLDQRGLQPSYRCFTMCGTPGAHTIAPNISHAREVRNAFLEFAARFGPQERFRVVMRKLMGAP